MADKHVKDKLADELRRIGLWSMAQKAADGFYDDFLSPLPMPISRLVADLGEAGTSEALALQTRVMNGEFDAKNPTAGFSIGSGPVDAEYAEMMSKIAHGIDEFLNGTTGEKKIGFILMVFPFSDGSTGHERCNYMSNAARAEVVTLLKEQISYFEGMPDMQKAGHA
jgi:hypothetical protein